MSIIFASMMLLFISSAYAILMKRKLAETYFLAVVTVIFVIYGFGLMNRQGSLLYGIYVLGVLTILSIGYLVFALVKKRDIVAGAEILQGTSLFVIFMLFSLFMNYGRRIIHEDEFSHWGTIVKHFYYQDALGSVTHPNYILMAPNYSPGSGLFQYFFTRFSNHFVESNAYIAMNVMYFSMIMPFVKNIFSKEKWLGQLLVLLAFFLLPLVFPYDFYTSLLVSIMSGLLFGISLLYYFMFKYEKSLYGVLLVAASTFLLTSIVNIGILFSLGVFTIIIADILFWRREELKGNIERRATICGKIRYIGLLFLPLMFTLFAELSWSNLLVRGEVPLNIIMPTFLDAFHLFTGQGFAPHQSEARTNFVVAIFTRQVPELNISVFTFNVIFLLILLILLSFYRNQENKYLRYRFIMSGLFLSFGFFVYQFVFAVLYVYAFCPFEGPRLASFERYMASYMLGMLLFLLLIVLHIPSLMGENCIKRLKEIKASDRFVTFYDLQVISKGIIFVLVCVCSFGLLFGITAEGMERVFLDRVAEEFRFRPRATAVVAEKWMDYFIESPPYFIFQGNRGDGLWRMRYELMPHATIANPRWGWTHTISTEPMFEPEDIWTLIVTPEEWEEYVLESGYETVFVFRSDEVLRTDFGHFFEGGVRNDMLYHVINDNGNLRLIPVEKESE